MTTTQLTAAHKALRRLVGRYAYGTLLKGRPLEVWRNSSPHNYWIGTKGYGGASHIWHSWEREYPDMRLFRELRHSDERVITYWGLDSGRPCHSYYVLNKRGAVKP